MGDAIVENVGEIEVKPQWSCKLVPVRVAFSRSRTKTIKKAFPAETNHCCATGKLVATKIYVKLVFLEISTLFKTHLSYSTETSLTNS